MATHRIEVETPSEPEGSYILVPSWVPVLGSIKVGSMVYACMPAGAQGFALRHDFMLTKPDPRCHGTAGIAKRVWGLAGQRFSLTSKGALVDGALVAASIPQRATSKGVPLPTAAPTVVPPGYVVGGSAVQKSYDSRYYGAVRPLGRLYPLFIDGPLQ